MAGIRLCLCYLLVCVAVESRFGGDGRMKQLEYAMRATEEGGLVIGLEACDGSVIVAMVSDEYSKNDDGEFKVASVAPNVIVATAGVASDARHAVSKCRVAAVEHWLMYGERPSARVVARALAKHAASYSRSPLSDDDESNDYATVRPPGLASLIAGVDDLGEGALFSVNAAGLATRFRAAAVGKGADRASSLLANRVADYLAKAPNNKCWDMDSATAIDIALDVIEAHAEEAQDDTKDDYTQRNAEREFLSKICIALLARSSSDSTNSIYADKNTFSSATFDDGWWAPNAPAASILSEVEVKDLLNTRRKERLDE